MIRIFTKRLTSQRFGTILYQNFNSTGSRSFPQSTIPPNVQGLSDRVVNVPNYPVGFAGASKEKEYKNPEYFCYHVDSFADAMVELEKYRLPVPSNKRKK